MIAVAVSESDSIMYYTDGADLWTYNNNSFVPVFTDDIENWVWSSESFKQTAYDTCGNDTACLVDVYVTGDRREQQSYSRIQSGNKRCT